MSRRRVVVTGLGLVSPVGNTVAEGWARLVAGRSGIDLITKFDAAAFACRIAGEVKGLLDQLGLDAVVEQPGHPPGQGAGLAGAGAGHHQDGPLPGLHHGHLLLVEEPLVGEGPAAAGRGAELVRA